MSGLMILLGLGGVLFLVHRLILLFPPKARLFLWVAVLSLGGSLPFWHYLSPTYRQFQELCSRPDRDVVFKTVEVDYLFFRDFDKWAYRAYEGRGFKGLEAFDNNSRSFVRFTPIEKWDSPACRPGCREPRDVYWKKACESCLTKTDIAEPEYQFEVKLGFTELVKDRITQSKQVMRSPSGENLAITINYTYHPPGTKWMLERRPFQNCETDERLDIFKVLKPKVKQ